MRRHLLVWIVVAAAAGAFVWWIAGHTYWADTTVPMPLQGEAARNPFYAAQRFAEALGARTVRAHAFTEPPADGVVVLSGWHWSLSPQRRERIERWVESGGRLVVDRLLTGGADEFARWSGIEREPMTPEAIARLVTADADPDDQCRPLVEGTPDGGTPASPGHRLCDIGFWSLRTKKSAEWTLQDASGIHAMRVPVGRGSVTAINAAPFRFRDLLEGDHAQIFVSATALRRGDIVHFLSEAEHPSLLALAWQHGAPIVLLGLSIIALLLWRGGVRFGPLVPPAPLARRSLAEQIRGTGGFAWRHGGGEALHAATVRALDAAAIRRVPGYGRMTGKDRAAAVARLTGFDRHALAAAIHHPRLRRVQELRGTIALLETARRRTLETRTGRIHD